MVAPKARDDRRSAARAPLRSPLAARERATPASAWARRSSFGEPAVRRLPLVWRIAVIAALAVLSWAVLLALGYLVAG